MDPRSLLDRWKGRTPPSPSLKSALEDLERLGVSRPELATPALRLGQLLAAAFQEVDLTPVPGYDVDLVINSWQQGLPVFEGMFPRIEANKLLRRMRNLVQALGTSNESARAFAVALRAGKIPIMDWSREVVAGRSDGVARDAERLGLDVALAASLLRFTLLPSLARFSAELDRVRPDATWTRGDCPHCGSSPLLTESRGLEQRIYHRCGLCAADWPGERLRCPSCSETSSKSLHYSFVEGEQDRCRLAHCDTCRYDWKVVSTLTPLTPPAMIVADLATVHLDLLAEARRGDQAP